MTKTQILEYLKSKKPEFVSKYGIATIGIYGSYARDEASENSDIDIAIQTPLSDYFLLYDFKETLENELSLKVDLIRIRDAMNPYLKQRIAKEAIYV